MIAPASLIHDRALRVRRALFLLALSGSLLVALLALLSCDDPVEPVPPPPPHVQQDTTSHEIEWTVYLFGPGIPSSSLRDIIAFSDTNVWFVGGVFPETPDTGALGRDPYTVLRWNGREWRKFKVPMRRCRTQSIFMSSITSVAGLPNDLWLCSSAGEGAKWNGLEFYPICVKADSTRPWGAACKDILFYSENEVYFAGDILGTGEITRYSNGSYSKISSFPDSPVTSLAGDGKGNLWAGGYDLITGKGSFIWRTPSGSVIDIRKSELIDGEWDFLGVSSLWISRDSLYAYTAGYLYIQALYDTSHYRYLSGVEVAKPWGYKTCITGNGDNDVFMAGGFMTVVHYNGKSLRSYPELSRMFVEGGVFHAISVTKDYVYVAGTTQQTQAVVAIGKRIH
jgi:hypothetical protein